MPEGVQTYRVVLGVGVARLEGRTRVNCRAEGSEINAGQLTIVQEARIEHLRAHQLLRVESRETARPPQVIGSAQRDRAPRSRSRLDERGQSVAVEGPGSGA